MRKNLVVNPNTENSMPGRFRSVAKLQEVLNYLEKRRLIGLDDTLGLVDVHPVVRGQVMKHILKQTEPGDKKDTELLQYLYSDNSGGELMLRALNQPDFEERFRDVNEWWNTTTEESQLHSSTVLNILSGFYPNPQKSSSPWCTELPALRLRKSQAWCLLRTGGELMTRGHWEESQIVYNHAKAAYRLCGEEQALEDCQRNHDWQVLYSGNLRSAEQRQLDLLEQGKDSSSRYWLALLLSIRQSEHAARLLQSLPVDTNRWTLQTIAEAWFYLGDYQKAADLAQQAWDRHEEERVSVGQLLWEAVTIGLALVRLGKFDEARKQLDFALDRGTGWLYNIVPMFARAGFIECYYEQAMLETSPTKKRDLLINAEASYKLYIGSDSTNQFQIPAAAAHLAMAKVLHAQNQPDEAISKAQLALSLACKHDAPFQYGSVAKRATDFLVEELHEKIAPSKPISYADQLHEKRVQVLIESWKGEAQK